MCPHKMLSFTRTIELWLFCAVAINCCSARGPHHPRGDVNKHRVEQAQHATEHLAYEKEHIEEDLKEHHLPTDKKIEDMTEDEKSYLFFKVHDLDGNDKLDGLEIFYSATHHSTAHHEHEASDDTKPQSNDSELRNDLTLPNLKMLKLDENGQLVDESFNHVIDVLNDFLSLADLNDDGYLNFAEYAAAMKLGNAIIEDREKSDL